MSERTRSARWFGERPASGEVRDFSESGEIDRRTRGEGKEEGKGKGGRWKTTRSFVNSFFSRCVELAGKARDLS